MRNSQFGFSDVDASREHFTAERIQWILRLRWGAMLGVVAASALGSLPAFHGVRWKGVLVVGLCGLVYNTVLTLLFDNNRLPTTRSAAVRHALVDLFALTIVLFLSGGVDSPFLKFYIFHVTLIGILGGKRGAVVAVGAALLGAAFLSLSKMFPVLHVSDWNPASPWDTISEIVAFVMTVFGAAYIILQALVELRDRERALATAKEQADLEKQLLENTLDELDVGLEVVDTDGGILWRNKHGDEMSLGGAVGVPWTCPHAARPCDKQDGELCPVLEARQSGKKGRCRFAISDQMHEHVYEMMVFPIDELESPRVMNLYVNRTEATIAERQLLLAERLASLGRVAQGVAHELNTPLATIRTLATDMKTALRELEDEPEKREANIEDLHESASIIGDETRRLGVITQALLSGGDLVRPDIQQHAPLHAVVERASAIVFAGVRNGPTVVIGEGIDALEVVADRNRLMQILVNLLQNANDAMGGREGSLTLHAIADAHEVRLMVDDEGEGLDPSVATRLFEPFSTSKPVGEGTGLGLYTSYMLAKEMGGDLTLKNRDEGGVRATVTLPRFVSSKESIL